MNTTHFDLSRYQIVHEKFINVSEENENLILFKELKNGYEGYTANYLSLRRKTFCLFFRTFQPKKYIRKSYIEMYEHLKKVYDDKLEKVIFNLHETVENLFNDNCLVHAIGLIVTDESIMDKIKLKFKDIVIINQKFINDLD